MNFQVSKILGQLVIILILTSAALSQTREELNARCWDFHSRAQYQKGLDLAESILSQNSADDLISADTHHVKGELLFGLARYPESIQAYARALDIRREKLSSRDPLVALTLVDLGLPYKKLGDLKKARELYQQALTLAQEHFPKHSTTARIHNNLGALFELEGLLRSAEAHYMLALQIKNELDDPASLATTLNNLGELNRRRGRLDQARQYFSQALEVRQKTLGKEHPDTIMSQQNLAVLQLALAQWERAKMSLEACLESSTKVLGVEHPRTAAILGNLSVLYLNLYHDTSDKSHLTRSIAYREKELSIRRKLHPKSPLTSDSILELALLRREAGDSEEAVALMRQSMRNGRGLSKVNILARLSFEMAATLAEQKDLDGALKHSRNSLNLYQEATGFNNHLALNALSLYGMIQVEQGDILRAERATREFLKSYEDNLAQVFSFTSERQRLGYVSRINVYELPFKLGDPQLMARTVLRHKGLVLDSLVEDFDLARLDPESAKVAVRLQEVGEELVRLEMAGEKSPRVAALRQQLGELEGQLAQPFAERTRRALKVTPEDVQKGLPEGAKLVEYIRVGNEYGALVLSDETIHWQPLGSAAHIDETLFRSRRALQRLDRDLGDTLSQLYKLVWAPLKPALGDAKHVILSPDSNLNFLSFATLITPEDRFLVEEINLEYVASGRDILQPRRPHRKDAHLIGDVAFGNSEVKKPQTSDSYPLNLSPLPGTAEECEKLGALMEEHEWTQEFSRGEMASESRVRKLKAPGVLHFATHGFFLPKGRGVDNPMLRGGLALAGSASTIQNSRKGHPPPPDNDGLLTAEEVGHLDLEETWLVCLSSCETGLGEVVDGEGVLGLRRGFLQSGAQNLLLTLWPIDDSQTADFMLDFYRACLTGQHPSRALIKVQRDWLVRLRVDEGLPTAVFIAGPFILNGQVK